MACSVAPICILRLESAILVHVASLSYKLSVVFATDAVDSAALLDVGEGRRLITVLDIAHLDEDVVRNLSFGGLNCDRGALFGRRDGDNLSTDAILICGLRMSLLSA